MDEIELVAKAKNGNKKAMGTLLARYQQKLFRTALGITANPHDADDALQETALKSWLKIKTLREEKDFSFWLTKILINVCRDILRKKKDILPGDLWIDSPAAETKIASWLDFQEDINTLSKVHREVIALRFIQDLTFKEIAYVTDTPESTVKYRMESALKVLREKYQDKDGVKTNDL